MKQTTVLVGGLREPNKQSRKKNTQKNLKCCNSTHIWMLEYRYIHNVFMAYGSTLWLALLICRTIYWKFSPAKVYLLMLLLPLIFFPLSSHHRTPSSTRSFVTKSCYAVRLHVCTCLLCVFRSKWESLRVCILTRLSITVQCQVCVCVWACQVNQNLYVCIRQHVYILRIHVSVYSLIDGWVEIECMFGYFTQLLNCIALQISLWEGETSAFTDKFCVAWNHFLHSHKHTFICVLSIAMVHMERKIALNVL